MNLSSIYHTVFIYNEGRFVMDMDFTNRGDALRETIALQEDGFTTELLTLSDAPLFDTAPDDYGADVDRLAY